MNDEGLAAIADLQVRVDKLRKELRSERETRKWAIIAVVVLIVVGGLINGGLLHKVDAQAEQLRGNRVADCERGNVARAALVELADAMPQAIFSALVTVTNQNRTPEEQARVDVLVTEAARVAAENTAPQRAALAPRDCSPEAVNP